jgi:hypothetical protein
MPVNTKIVFQSWYHVLFRPLINHHITLNQIYLQFQDLKFQSSVI